MISKKRVLIAGVYLLDRENTVDHLMEQFSCSRDWEARQAWLALGEGEVPSGRLKHTVGHHRAGAAKFVLINQLLASIDLEPFDFVLLCDDDIRVAHGFLDQYLSLVVRHDFALAQPARTLDSYIDHPFVRRLPGIRARQTRFVEIGPLFSMRRDAAGLLYPFDEESPMGWGYDFAWPRVLEAQGLKLGIMDATPVAHNLRKPVSHYRHADADEQGRTFLLKHPHLSRMEAFSIVESFAE